MGFFGFGKKSKELKAAAKKVDKRDMMQASVAIALLVAFADGGCSDEELVALDKLINSNPALNHFGAELGKTLEQYKGMMEAGVTLGRIKLMREIMDCEHSPEEKEEVFAIGIDIAASDGDIDPAEVTVLKDIAGKLGLSAKAFGLE